ncbi:MAG: Gfo/Idh/MocA family protein [Woeseiaceae bacterium]
MNRIRIALVGIGKIARDQHVQALSRNGAFQLVAAVSRHQTLDDLPNYTSLGELLDAQPDVNAVAICTPPQVRFEVARFALQHRRHVLLEKPPGATLNEVYELIELAHREEVALFAAWHSREAAAVEPARRWLATRKLRSVDVTWKDDVRVWHPGQTGIWKAGGLGVFDPGINALSIVTQILRDKLVLKDAELSFPSNCDAPIAASLRLTNAHGTPVRMELDFLQTGPPTWDIEIATDAGRLRLSRGGAVMQIDDQSPFEAPDNEYGSLYARFETLVREGRVDVDLEPFRLVADAFLCGRRVVVEPLTE